jgi:pimeloyl-ACP methyl ester carboxylesterase
MYARLSLLRYVPIMFTVFLGLVLGACAHPGKGDFTFYVPDYSGLRDVPVHYLAAYDGTPLAYREIVGIESNKAVIIVPGSTMYGYYYLPFMKDMGDAGLFTRVIDLRGHGDSGGGRGDVPHEDSLVDDLHAHIEHITSLNPQARIYIAGHSMGAGICGRYLEKYGYDSVEGAIYIAPFFHYRQPGMKGAGYVDVDIFKTIFGGDHVVTQVYHPTGDDPKLVREYTKIMSTASMLNHYSSFSHNHTTRALYLMGTKDELFDWQDSPTILSGCGSVKVIIIDGATHLDILGKSANPIQAWINDVPRAE